MGENVRNFESFVHPALGPQINANERMMKKMVYSLDYLN